MDKPGRYKAKGKKPATKSKTAKKKSKTDGPTCSMFLAEITRKLASRKKQAEEVEMTTNIIQTIIESITNALPIIISKKESPQKIPSLMKIETLQSLAPELARNDTINFIPIKDGVENDDVSMIETEIIPEKPGQFKMPKMPVVSSEILKLALAKNRKMLMHDQGVNTGTELDVAAEISKHVSTLRKISLIAEEFNQKTGAMQQKSNVNDNSTSFLSDATNHISGRMAMRFTDDFALDSKNLKEIVDSVQEDLIKKLAEVEAEQRSASERAFRVQPTITQRPTGTIDEY